METLKAIQALGWGSAISWRDYLRAHAQLFWLVILVCAVAMSLSLGLRALGASKFLGLYIPLAAMAVCLLWVVLQFIKLSVNRFHDFGQKALWWVLYMYGLAGVGLAALSTVLPERTILALTAAVSLSIVIIDYFLLFEKGREQDEYPVARLFETDHIGVMAKIAVTVFVAASLLGLSNALATLVLSYMN